MNNYLSFEQLKNLPEGDWVWVVNKKEEREEYAVIRRGPKCFSLILMERAGSHIKIRSRQMEKLCRKN